MAAPFRTAQDEDAARPPRPPRAVKHLGCFDSTEPPVAGRAGCQIRGEHTAWDLRDAPSGRELRGGVKRRPAVLPAVLRGRVSFGTRSSFRWAPLPVGTPALTTAKALPWNLCSACPMASGVRWRRQSEASLSRSGDA